MEVSVEEGIFIKLFVIAFLEIFILGIIGHFIINKFYKLHLKKNSKYKVEGDTIIKYKQVFYKDWLKKGNKSDKFSYNSDKVAKQISIMGAVFSLIFLLISFVWALLLNILFIPYIYAYIYIQYKNLDETELFMNNMVKLTYYSKNKKTPNMRYCIFSYNRNTKKSETFYISRCGEFVWQDKDTIINRIFGYDEIRKIEISEIIPTEYLMYKKATIELKDGFKIKIAMNYAEIIDRETGGVQKVIDYYKYGLNDEKSGIVSEIVYYLFHHFEEVTLKIEHDSLIVKKGIEKEGADNESSDEE